MAPLPSPLEFKENFRALYQHHDVLSRDSPREIRVIEALRKHYSDHQVLWQPAPAAQWEPIPEWVLNYAAHQANYDFNKAKAFCMWSNQPSGAGCSKKDCKYEHKCLICGDRHHGAFTKKPDKTMVCPELKAFKVEAEKFEAWYGMTVRSVKEQLEGLCQYLREVPAQEDSGAGEQQAQKGGGKVGKGKGKGKAAKGKGDGKGGKDKGGGKGGKDKGGAKGGKDKGGAKGGKDKGGGKDIGDHGYQNASWSTYCAIGGIPSTISHSDIDRDSGLVVDPWANGWDPWSRGTPSHESSSQCPQAGKGYGKAGKSKIGSRGCYDNADTKSQSIPWSVHSGTVSDSDCGWDSRPPADPLASGCDPWSRETPSHASFAWHPEGPAVSTTSPSWSAPVSTCGTLERNASSVYAAPESSRGGDDTSKDVDDAQVRIFAAKLEQAMPGLGKVAGEAKIFSLPNAAHYTDGLVTWIKENEAVDLMEIADFIDDIGDAIGMKKLPASRLAKCARQTKGLS